MWANPSYGINAIVGKNQTNKQIKSLLTTILIYVNYITTTCLVFLIYVSMVNNNKKRIKSLDSSFYYLLIKMLPGMNYSCENL